MEEVTHRVDEHPARRSPVKRLLQPLGPERQIEAILEGMSDYTSEAFGKPLRVAGIATTCQLGTPCNRVPRRISPFDLRATCHVAVSSAIEQKQNIHQPSAHRYQVPLPPARHKPASPSTLRQPGRPSHAYHAFLMAGTRLVLDDDVAPGNRHRSKSAAPSLWALLDCLGREHRPRLIRGDKDWGSEGNMVSCEGASLDYLFKLRLTKGARRLAERLMARDEWEDAGQGWSGIEAELRLQGWSRTRRVVVLRRRLPGTVALTRSDDGQGDLFWTDAQPGTGVWEFAVLATSLDFEVRSLAQLYRDRAAAENGFDELKDEWGWGGFTTRDLKRCQYMVRLIALIYNWWSLFVRLAGP